MRRGSLLSLLLLAGSAAADQPQAKVIDEGKFVLEAGGKPVGEESFTIRNTGGAQQVETHTSLNMGHDMAVDGTLTTDASWRPLGASFKRVIKNAQGEVTTSDMVLKKVDGVLVQVSDGETKEKAPSDLFILGGTFTHMAAACTLAGDAEKQLVVFPGAPITLAAKKPATAVHAGKPIDTFVVMVTIGGGAKVQVACQGAQAIVMTGGGLVATRAGWEDARKALMGPQYEKPVLPDGLVDLDRTVDRGDALLSCSLLLPKKLAEVKTRGKQALPAVVFVTGSGPEDRDEDTPPGVDVVRKSPFKVMAIALGESGIASLRCDDRGVSKSTGDITKVTMDVEAADVVALLKALRDEPAVDPRRIGIIGHSYGGVEALMAATADQHVQALALLASPGRPGDEFSYDQQYDAARAKGLTEDQIKQMHAHYVVIYEAIKKGKLPDDMDPDERKYFEPLKDYMAVTFRIDPVGLARRLKQPMVLIAQGTKDFQVKVIDAENLRDAFAKGGNKRVTFKTYPGLSHLFGPAKTGTLADYSDPDLQMDATFLNDVVGFLRKALK